MRHSTPPAPAPGADRRRAAGGPQLRHEHPEPAQQLAQQREAQPDDGVMVALEPRDERPADPVDGERTGHRERLPGRHVRVDLGVGQVGEVHQRRGGRPGGAGRAVAGVHQPVAGVQHAGPPAHPTPPPGRVRRVGRLAQRLAVQLEQRVAAEHHQVVRERDAVRVRLVGVQGRGHRVGLGAGQGQHGVGRVQRGSRARPRPAPAPRPRPPRRPAPPARSRPRAAWTASPGTPRRAAAWSPQARASRRVSRPTEPSASARAWNSLRFGSAPWARSAARASSRAVSHSRWPILYDGAWPAQPR